MVLPEQFKESMKDLLAGEYDSFIASYDEEPVMSLRINPSKVSAAEFEKIAPFKAEPVPFADNGYYIRPGDGWSKHPYYHAGLYYIQEASAMLPADRLPVDDNDSVLDLCAAPGGKSTALSTENVRILVSNDISHSRAIPLVKNLEHFGRGNYLVTCMDPAVLLSYYPEKFDKVLVDAPCSGEGMFRKDAHLIESYMSKGPDHYSRIQQDILESAYRMTKPGGMIMYSTCTFSDIENEQNVLMMLQHHKDLEICDIDKRGGLSGVYGKYGSETSVRGCVHAFPHKMRSEGHFLALFKKNEGSAGTTDQISGDTAMGYDRLSKELHDFLDLFCDEVKIKLKNSRFTINRSGVINILPEGHPGFLFKDIRYLSTGTCMGTIRRSGRFVVHTSLALSLSADDYQNTVDLSSDDQNVYRYLRGETVMTGELSPKPGKGCVLVCVDGYPLGFAINDGVRLKNMYEKGWVIG